MELGKNKGQEMAALLARDAVSIVPSDEQQQQMLVDLYPTILAQSRMLQSRQKRRKEILLMASAMVVVVFLLLMAGVAFMSKNYALLKTMGWIFGAVCATCLLMLPLMEEISKMQSIKGGNILVGK